MPERYSSEPGPRGSSSPEADQRFQDDPLAELARLVAGPSPLTQSGATGYSLPGTSPSPNSAASNPAPGNSALDENLESELTRSAAPQEGIDPFADLSWLDAEAAKPSAVEAPPASPEPNFDEFVNMHMRRAGRPGMRRTPARSLPAMGAGWDGIDLDQPPVSPEGDSAASAANQGTPSEGFSASRNAALFSEAPALPEGAMAAEAAQAESKPSAFSEERFGENSALFGEFSDDDETGGRRGPPRAVLLAGAAAVLLVLGGFGALTYFNRDTGKSAAPGVIAADKNPVKVAPSAPAASAVAARDAAANNKLVYDRVDEPAADKLKTAPAPVTTAPRPEAQTTDAGRELARLAAEGAANDAADLAANVKRVRTVVVRPDGTVVANAPAAPPAAAPAVRPTTVNTPAPASNAPPPASPASAPAARPAIANPAPPAASPPATAAKTNTAPAPATPAAPATAANAAAKPATGAAAPAGAAPTIVVAANSAAKPAAPAAPAPAATPKQAAASAPVPLVPESADSKTAAATRTAAVAPNASAIVPGAEGWVVQVTSQKSESAALTAFKDMQKRFPALLGARQPDMQRVDLGSRGVFYRVRVGPVGTQEAASGLCDTLKGGGADCIVVRN